MHTGNLQREIDGLGWQFDHSYARLPDVFYARVQPEPVSAPSLVVVNHDLAQSLGLQLSQVPDARLAALFTGSALPGASEPIAQAYAGHQFGHFTMLGDGRVLLLGEQITPTGARYDLQFKGSGRTPFSRRGDGRAALGPMLREYLISEAMHGLKIPTTRSLAVAMSGDWVYRDPPQPGAVLTRVAASHVRVGTFQFAAGFQRHQGSLENAAAASEEASAVRTLLRYAIARHDPDLQHSDRPALDFLKAVVDRQISLVVQWMRVGFVHGVMNTDNMAISGETIDYGPCAFLDTYHPETVFSSIDHAGRYAYENQPAIAQWNLARLAEALLTEIDSDTDRAIGLAGDLITGFSAAYETAFFAMMARKIGIAAHTATDKEDVALVADLLQWMQQAQADYTYTFWRLGQPDVVLAGLQPQDPSAAQEADDPAWQMFLSPDHERRFDHSDFRDWKNRWLKRLGSDLTSRRVAQQCMARENPVVVPRNAQVESALTAAVTDQDLAPFKRLVSQLQHPYTLRDQSRTLVRPPETDLGYRTFCGT